MLLYMFIDILERLTSWLKKFTGRSNVFTSDIFRGGAVADIFEDAAGKPTPDVVRAKFDSLRGNPPTGPKGHIVEQSTGVYVVGKADDLGEPAPAGVWTQMFSLYGRWYDVRRSGTPGG